MGLLPPEGQACHTQQRTGTSESAFLVMGVLGGVGRLEEQCKHEQSRAERVCPVLQIHWASKDSVAV